MSVIDRDWVRPAPTRRQVRVDVLIGVVAVLLGVASVEVWRSAVAADLGAGGIEAYLWFAVAGLALAGRRSVPLATVVVESVVFIAIGERLEEFAAVFTIQMVLFASLYSAWAWSRRPRALTAVSALVVLGMFGWLVWLFRDNDSLAETASTGLLSPAAAAIIYSFVINLVYFGGAIAWGQAAWMSARRRALIEEKMEREREQGEAERRRAVQAERVRIARDLHDVVAHHVSGIGVQAAGAARLVDRNPESARRALRTIETSSRQAVTQMHQLVGLLREDDEERAAGRGPQPGIGDIADLVAQSQDLQVDLRVVGAETPVPATVGLSLYRIVQEALTNVRRHSRARRAAVTVRHLTEPAPAVEVEVLDDGPHVHSGPESTGGFGLAGIRERASTHDADVEIGPRPHGGYRVRVRVPLESEPVETLS